MNTSRYRRTAAAWIAISACWTGAAPVVLACPVCFRLEEGPTAAGLRMAVSVMVGITLTVLGGAALFVARMVRRSARVSIDAPDA